MVVSLQKLWLNDKNGGELVTYGVELEKYGGELVKMAMSWQRWW